LGGPTSVVTHQYYNYHDTFFGNKKLFTINFFLQLFTNKNTIVINRNFNKMTTL